MVVEDVRAVAITWQENMQKSNTCRLQEKSRM
jgi:hypothetical protein